jgi:hypothetical protein
LVTNTLHWQLIVRTYRDSLDDTLSHAEELKQVTEYRHKILKELSDERKQVWLENFQSTQQVVEKYNTKKQTQTTEHLKILEKTKGKVMVIVFVCLFVCLFVCAVLP